MRPDLTFRLQEYQGAPCYVIEDDLNSRFYRVGVAEYNLISLLDGTTTVSQAIATTSAAMGDMAINEHEAIAICNWLIQSELASTQQSRTAGRLSDSHEKSSRRKAFSRLNPISTKIPLFNPDRLLALLSPALGWLFSLPMSAVWALVVATGGYQVWSHWDQATSGANQILDRSNWLYLGLVWLGLKLVHELAHGLVCKRFGASVRQTGIVFILLLPLPFVDVTQIWKLDSKWKRIFVAAAGMYVEIFLAAVAALLWAPMEPGIAKQILFNVMVAGSVTTVLFNINPLMKFDGYYMLADFLELPNLATHGQQWLAWLGKKFYLGMDVQQPTWPEGKTFTVATYAILAFAWRILICITLILAAEALLYGLGLVLAMAAFVLWVIIPTAKLLRFVFLGDGSRQKPSAIRFVALTSVVSCLLWGLLNHTPWHSRIEAPAIVDFHAVHEVRTPVSGFVREILIEPGQSVKKGDLLVRLENPELQNEIDDLRLAIGISKVRAGQYRTEQRIPSYQVEINNGRSLVKRLSERIQQQNQLAIRAPEDGQLIVDDLNSLLGSYLAAGQTLCSLGTGDEREIQALIAQNNYDAFQDRTLQNVQIHVWGFGSREFQGRLKQVVPKARLQLPHPAFASTAGGPLPVRFASTQGDPSGTGVPASPSSVQLIEPHFLGQVHLLNSDDGLLNPGQRCTVSFRGSSGTVGSVLYDFLYKWFTRQKRAAKGQS